MNCYMYYFMNFLKYVIDSIWLEFYRSYGNYLLIALFLKDMHFGVYVSWNKILVFSRFLCALLHKFIKICVTESFWAQIVSMGDGLLMIFITFKYQISLFWNYEIEIYNCINFSYVLVHDFSETCVTDSVWAQIVGALVRIWYSLFLKDIYPFFKKKNYMARNWNSELSLIFHVY